MSKLSNKIKNELKRHIFEGRCLELFPGEDNDSIKFLHSITESKIISIGNNKLAAPHMKFILCNVPPYPWFFRKFDYIFLNEAEWLWIEHGLPVKTNLNPDKALKFIDKYLKFSGKLIISNIHELIEIGRASCRERV